MLEAEQLSFQVGPHKILDNVSLTLHPGRLLAVLGANGAGKSTLLRIMTGQCPDFSGSVRYNGQDLRRFRARELARKRAVLSQQLDVSFDFSVREVVELGRGAFNGPHDGSEASHQEIIDRMMHLTGISDWADRMYPTLSGGEQQRVQLTRVLTQLEHPGTEARYLFLDEPTSSLDLAQQHHMLQRVRNQISETLGVLAILHDLNLALAFADDVLLLKHGQLVACGPLPHTLNAELLEYTYDYPMELRFEPEDNRPYARPRIPVGV